MSWEQVRVRRMPVEYVEIDGWIQRKRKYGVHRALITAMVELQKKYNPCAGLEEFFDNVDASVNLTKAYRWRTRITNGALTLWRQRRE